MPETEFELKTIDCVEGMQQMPDESIDVVKSGRLLRCHDLQVG